MGNNKKPDTSSRRSFFSLLFTGKDPGKTEKVKMLTADGKLVEVDKAVLDQARKNKKTTNKEILHWMKNPSKKNS
ncbi:MAG: hypothetical protein Q8941_08220 [Bacteroidota bacterium]|nr:hypothetical protein [Bacteroidota bacterium]